jgi:hypothetical protein
MVKLTDTQLALLSMAAARDDGAATLPDHLGKAAAFKLGSILVAGKLMREIRSKPGMPVWRQNDQERNVSLVITKAGRVALGIEQEEGQQPASKVIGNHTPASTNKSGARSSPRSGSKQARVITLLSTRSGASIVSISEEMGWLSHTTRAVLTGLRKRGYGISRISDDDGKSRYRIDGEPQVSSRG